MGINLEYATLLSELRSHLTGGKVMEFGAQDISASKTDMALHIKRLLQLKDAPAEVATAKQLYALLGYDYTAIDASGEYGALIYDLNKDVVATYDYKQKFELVTNLGTIEHCFNQSQAFENMHNLCALNGLMIHAFPSAGNANHGLYNIQPRLLLQIAEANDYEILSYVFTVDYKPELIAFTHDNYATYDDRDLMCYVAFRKRSDKGFVGPFDSIFDDKNQLQGYAHALHAADFRSYIKGTWSNVKPTSLSCVPTRITNTISPMRKLIKILINLMGRYIQ